MIPVLFYKKIGVYGMDLGPYDYETVVKIIQEIRKLHFHFSNNLEEILTYNLKKTIDKVASVEGVNSDFQELLDRYKAKLNQFTVFLLSLHLRYPGIRYRVKQSESIREKIIYYLGPEHEDGKVSINKSLNDLLGFRIFVENLEIIYTNLCKDNEVKKIINRMYMRNKDGYLGLHIYFKNNNNKFFPWELQIWCVDNIKSNEQSHKEHKQKRHYISIPQNYHDADLEKEE